MVDEKAYERLADKAEAGSLAHRGVVSHDPDAGARFLMDATGTSSVDEAQRVALGRPRLGQQAGESPTVRFKTTVQMRDAMKRVARHEGLNVSEAWRAAAQEYLQHHQLQDA